jgi:hypothetical protein
MIQTFLLDATTKKLPSKRPTLGAMAEEEKGGVPDDLKDAIAENLRNYMRRELYDPENPNDLKRLSQAAGVHVRTLERLLRRSTYPDHQPNLESLAQLAAVLRVETHHLVYKPRLEGGTNLSVTKATNSARRNKAEKR